MLLYFVIGMRNGENFITISVLVDEGPVHSVVGFTMLFGCKEIVRY